MYNYEIKPVFYANEIMCKDFAHIELLCDENRGYKHNDIYKQYCENYYFESDNDTYGFRFVALHDKKIIGFATGHFDENMFLDNLYVKPEFHGFGVGTRLLQTAENAVAMIAPNMELCPLNSAVGFYQQHKYNRAPGRNTMIKKLPKIISGVVPLFEWCDELSVKLNVNIDIVWLKNYKHQPKFVYIGKDNKIDGIGVLLSNGEKCIKLNDKQKSLKKSRTIELNWALDCSR